MKKVVFTILLMAALAVSGAYLYRNTRQVPSTRLILSGNIELTEVNIAFKTAGRLIDLTVNEGDPVTKGGLLAKMDKDQLLRQRERENASLVTAQAVLAQAEDALNWQRETVEADLDLRQAEISAASSRLLGLKSGARPEEIEEAKAAISVAQAEDERAKKDWARAQKLYHDDDISTAQYDQFGARSASAGASLKQAGDRLALLMAGARSEDIEQASAQVSRARAGLRMGQANQIETRRREQEVVARQSEIERARAQIALIDSQLADMTVTSPIDGVVLVKAADVGEVIAPGTTVVTVGDIDHPWLRAYVSEKDLGRVKLGSKVKITTDSFPGKIYDGRVSFIASEAEFTPKQIQTTEERIKLVYKIKIDAANPRHELKSNMPVDAEILVAE